jgi:hypothetical protein
VLRAERSDAKRQVCLLQANRGVLGIRATRRKAEAQEEPSVVLVRNGGGDTQAEMAVKSVHRSHATSSRSRRPARSPSQGGLASGQPTRALADGHGSMPSVEVAHVARRVACRHDAASPAPPLSQRRALFRLTLAGGHAEAAACPGRSNAGVHPDCRRKGRRRLAVALTASRAVFRTSGRGMPTWWR